MNRARFLAAFALLMLGFAAAARFLIPSVIASRVVGAEGRGPALIIACFLSQIPWLAAAAFRSRGPVRTFFIVAVCVMLLLAWIAAGNLNYTSLHLITPAALMGGVFLAWAAQFRKGAAPNARPKLSLRNGRALGIAAVTAFALLFVAGTILFGAAAGEVFRRQSSDFLLIASFTALFTFVLVLFGKSFERAPAVMLFTCLLVGSLLVGAPLLFPFLEGKRPESVQVAGYAFGLAAAFAILKAGKRAEGKVEKSGQTRPQT